MPACPAPASRTRPNARAKKFHPSPELCRGLATLRSDLFGYALKLSRCPETAADLVGDAMERAIRFQHTFQRGSNLRAWAHQILFNVFISRCRRHRLEKGALDVLATTPGAWTIPDQRAESIALSPPVARALDALPLQFRAAVVLVDLEEMSYKDAAILLGCKVGTLMSRLHRGRAMMAELMLGARELPRAAA